MLLRLKSMTVKTLKLPAAPRWDMQVNSKNIDKVQSLKALALSPCLKGSGVAIHP